MTQKKHFKQKLENIKKTIWDQEFKRYKVRELREEMRTDYDQMKSKREVLETQIKAQKDKPTMSEDERKRLDDQLEIQNRDIGRREEQMKALDEEIEGANPTNENPEGVQGINQQLDALRELKTMVEDYMKQI